MKKLLVFIFALTTYYLLLTTPSAVLAAPIVPPEKIGAAAGTWYVQPPDVWQQKVFGLPSASTTGGGGGGSSGFGTDQNAMFKERYTLSILVDMINSVLAGTMGTKTLVAQGPNGPVYGYEGGAVSVLADFSGYLYKNSPASSVEYLADLGQSVGLTKPAYAQGLGFTAFSPVLSLWKIFRDVAYLGFVVIFVIVGFMVMFRKKIDPRTVVTIQEALPRIVIALLLVTFSYAILGLMIDLMQFASTLLLNLVAKGISTTEADKLVNNNIFNLIPPIGHKVVDFAGKVASDANIPIPGGAVGDAAGKILAWVSVAVIFGIATFFIMFKIFFMLLGSYVGIVLSIIFSPIQLMLAAIPGNNTTISSWLKSVLANVLVFPITLVMLLIAYVFLVGTGANLTGESAISGLVPYLPSSGGLSWAPPLIGAKWGAEVGYFIAFGIVFTIPTIAEAVKHSLEVKPGPTGGAAEKEIRGGVSWIPIVGGLAGRAL